MHKAAVYSRQSGGGFVSNGRAACGRSAMAREYARVQEFYMQLHDLQPPAPHYQYGLTHHRPPASRRRLMSDDPTPHGFYAAVNVGPPKTEDKGAGKYARADAF
ncbi:unnamed protein product, partial [Iphiclides podalirius]